MIAEIGILAGIATMPQSRRTTSIARQQRICYACYAGHHKLQDKIAKSVVSELRGITVIYASYGTTMRAKAYTTVQIVGYADGVKVSAKTSSTARQAPSNVTTDDKSTNSLARNATSASP
jgi:hypothetical protein